MSQQPTTRSAAHVLVDQLLIHGTDTIFCFPGESYLPVLDALYQPTQTGQVRLISCRHEGGAAFMAEAHGKLSNRPGICFVTRGPGASNAAIGVHTAYHDPTPLILFIGQVARGFSEREAFQEIDFRRMFSPIAKWVTQIDDAKRIPELIARAYQLATSGRPGPVVIALPEDMLEETVTVADAAPVRRIQAHPGTEPMLAMLELLAAAERPLLLVGGGDWSATASEDIRAFARANTLPAVASFRAQDIIDNRSAEYVGALGVGNNPALGQRIAAADVLLLLGDRLSEMVTDDYRLLSVPRPQQTLIHVFPEPSELGRVYQPHLPILSGMTEFAAAARALPPLDATRWTDWGSAARADLEGYLRHDPMPGTLDLGEVFAHLRERLPRDAIITNGAGNYTAWCHRFLQFSVYRSQVAPANGTMGYGVPAAVAAKAFQPHRTVVAFAGDGCFLMNGQELATAMQYGLNIIVIVINNSMYGTIRMHQEQRFPDRVIGTGLGNPDFAQYARAFGAHGEIVTQTAEFAPALERALAAQVPALLELRIDPDAISPRTTLGAIRAGHQQKCNGTA
jgi:acetolactate synthase I/II/III large subunit